MCLLCLRLIKIACNVWNLTGYLNTLFLHVYADCLNYLGCAMRKSVFKVYAKTRVIRPACTPAQSHQDICGIPMYDTIANAQMQGTFLLGYIQVQFYKFAVFLANCSPIIFTDFFFIYLAQCLPPPPPHTPPPPPPPMILKRLYFNVQTPSVSWEIACWLRVLAFEYICTHFVKPPRTPLSPTKKNKINK